MAFGTGLAVIGLAVGGLYLSGGRLGPPPADSPAVASLLDSLPDPVATVDGRSMGRDLVRRALQDKTDVTRDDLRVVVRQLIEAQLLEEAADSLLRSSAEDRRRHGGAREDLLRTMVQVPPAEVHRLWTGHPGVFTGDFYGVRRVRGTTIEEARALGASLLAAARTGDDEAPPEWIGPGDVSPDIEEAVRALQPGAITAPLADAGGYAVVQLVDRRPGAGLSFADWEPRLTDYLQAERWHRERSRWLRLREACARVDVAPSLRLEPASQALDYFRRHPEVVAVVNGTPVTWDRLRERATQRRRMSRIPDDRPYREAEFRPMLGKLIETTLIQNEARKQGLTVADSEIDARYRKLRAGFGSDEELEAMLEASATSLSAWRRDMRSGLLTLKVEEAVAGRIPVTPEDIRAYWDANQSAFAGQSLDDHRDHIANTIRRTRWLQDERVRWVLFLLEHATIWNRFDLTLKLGQPAHESVRKRLGRGPAVVVMAVEQSCRAGLCDAVKQGWRHPVPLHLITGTGARRLARTWEIPVLPWAFAVDAAGRVLGECPGPLTEQEVARLADLAG